MAYTVFARKYRPQTFDGLVGQDHVARTLGNAIDSERVAHAFLFTGVRGVGKTTTARLLAKALNCEKGPTRTPCNECPQCLDITAGRDVDVQEIDGASHNGVEHVRRLQETLPYRPARDRFKIVIVDEVHMLSTGAFNAFLKTLEEPPEHVKFIFATTESHKVPITIRSRTQRYDFRPIPQATIAVKVREVLAAEGVEADDIAVSIVAREAGGSMRDALTLLDQLVAFSGGALEGDQVARTLGIAGRGHLQQIVDALTEGEPRAVLERVHELAENGTDPLHFAKQLAQLFRDLAVFEAVGADSSLVDFVAEERAWASALVGRVGTLELQRAFSAASQVVDEVAKASQPSIALEMGLLRIATRPALVDIATLLAALEGGGSDGGPSGGPARSGGSRADARGRAGASRRSAGGQDRGPRAMGSDAGPRDAAPDEERAPPAEPRGAQPGAGGQPDSRGPALDARSPMPDARSPMPDARGPMPDARGPAPDARGPMPDARGPAPDARGPAPDAPASDDPLRHLSPAARAAIAIARGEPIGAPASKPPEADAPPEPAAPVAPPAEEPVAAPAAPSEPPIHRSALAQWERVIAILRRDNAPLASVFAGGEPRVVNRDRVVIAYAPGSFLGRQAETNDAREAAARAAAELLGHAPAIEVRFDVDPASAARRTVAAVEQKRSGAALERRKRAALEHPVVQDALDVFPEANGHVEVTLRKVNG